MRTPARVFLAAILFSVYSDTAIALDIPEVGYSALPKLAAAAESFVPPGWEIEVKQEGDLNTDGLKDLLLVLRASDPANIVNNDPGSPGERSIDTNPRLLAVAFARKEGGYVLALECRELIPRHDNPTIDDPFGHADIAEGAVRVGLHLWANAGTWYTSDTTFIFEYRGKAFRLVGYEDYTTKRNTGQTWELKLDFVACKAELTVGSFSDEDVEDRTYQKTLPRAPLMAIEDLGCGWDYYPEPRDQSWWGLGDDPE